MVSLGSRTDAESDCKGNGGAWGCCAEAIGAGNGNEASADEDTFSGVEVVVTGTEAGIGYGLG